MSDRGGYRRGLRDSRDGRTTAWPARACNSSRARAGSTARPNASVIMASFLHGSPSGQRFSGPELGAWYASTELRTAVLEVATRLREGNLASAPSRARRRHYRQYKARLDGNFIDIFGLHPEFHDRRQLHLSHVRSPSAGMCGTTVQTRTASGSSYESVRRPGHENWVCFLPAAVMDVVQADHYEDRRASARESRCAKTVIAAPAVSRPPACFPATLQPIRLPANPT